MLDDFRNAFLDARLFDLGYSGYELTCCNYRENGVIVEECLDRFCANTDLSLLFPSAHVSHIDFDVSDHLPILLKCQPKESAKANKKRRFHSKNMWITEPSCAEVISNA